MAAVNTPDQRITSAEQQLTTLATATLPTGKLEGAGIGAISGIATFTDPAGVGVETAAGDFMATINWGDTTTSTGTVVSLGSGNYRLDAPTPEQHTAGLHSHFNIPSPPPLAPH